MAETKQSIVGIAIPEECGKADMYEIIVDNDTKVNFLELLKYPCG